MARLFLCFGVTEVDVRRKNTREEARGDLYTGVETCALHMDIAADVFVLEILFGRVERVLFISQSRILFGTGRWLLAQHPK